MLNHFFKKKKSYEELRKEQYVQSLTTVSEHYSGVRINETLAGKIKGIRMMETHCDYSASDSPKVPTLRSVPRPKSYGTDLIAWIQDIRQEAKTVINKNKQFDKEEQEYKEKVLTEKNNEALQKRREFFVNYGLLPKQTIQ